MPALIQLSPFIGFFGAIAAILLIDKFILSTPARIEAADIHAEAVGIGLDAGLTMAEARRTAKLKYSLIRSTRALRAQNTKENRSEFLQATSNYLDDLLYHDSVLEEANKVSKIANPKIYH